MTEQALYSFWNSFGVPAYPNTAVPDKRPQAYITYEVATGFLEDTPRSATINVWMRTTSELEPSNLVNKIAEKIGRGGIRIDDGRLWIKRGTPWMISTKDEDQEIKRRVLNVWYEFLT